jgi:heme exporter protein D
MNWGSWDAFLSMGGYGFYVWGSYAVTFALLASETGLLVSRKRSVVRELKTTRYRHGGAL